MYRVNICRKGQIVQVTIILENRGYSLYYVNRKKGGIPEKVRKLPLFVKMGKSSYLWFSLRRKRGFVEVNKNME